MKTFTEPRNIFAGELVKSRYVSMKVFSLFAEILPSEV